MQCAAKVATSTTETATWTSTSAIVITAGLHLSPAGATPVGSAVTQGGISNGTTIAVDPTANGDLLVAFLGVGSGNANGVTVGLSGGGVSSWSTAVGGYDAVSENECTVQYGVINSTGSSNITASLASGGARQIVVQQFTIGVPATWVVGPTSFTRTSLIPSLSPTVAGLWLTAAIIQGGTPVFTSTWQQFLSNYVGADTFAGYSAVGPGPGTVQPAVSGASSIENWATCMINGTPIPYVPSGRKIYSQAMNRGANFMRRANGLLTPKEGLVLPRLAL
jgi:hypothetical protein